jgi:glycosyltransferase involved in cell wall biosynthesis
MTADAVGGVWNFCVELARALEPHGVEIALASMGPAPTAAQREQIAALSNVDLHIGDFALEWMDNPWDDVDAAEIWLRRLYEEFAPDVIHLNGYVHAALPWRVPVLVTAHSCVTTWWQAVEGSRPPARYTEYLRRVQVGLSAANTVVAPTAAMMRALARFYMLPASCRVIANGRSPDLFWAGIKQPHIFSAGRIWDRAKNLRVLLDIAPDLPTAIHLAGDGGHNSTNVQYLGTLSERDLAHELSCAGIYAAPALYEPFGLSILEAGLSGCALVLSDLPSLREVWMDAAIFLPADSPRSWRNTLRELVHDPGRIAQLGGRSYTRALVFSPERCALSYLDCYGQLLRGQAAPLRKMVA